MSKSKRRSSPGWAAKNRPKKFRHPAGVPRRHWAWRETDLLPCSTEGCDGHYEPGYDSGEKICYACRMRTVPVTARLPPSLRENARWMS